MKSGSILITSLFVCLYFITTTGPAIGDELIEFEGLIEPFELVDVERARVQAAVEGEIKLQKEKLAFANRMHARVEELFNGEAISAEKNDQAASEVTFAHALLQKAMENRELARLDLERAKARLNQRTIKSPISGIVIERFVAAGEFVDNQPLLSGRPNGPLKG